MPGPRGTVEEDDGVLLGMVFDGESMRTSLAVSALAYSASQFSKHCTNMMSDLPQFLMGFSYVVSQISSLTCLA